MHHDLIHPGLGHVHRGGRVRDDGGACARVGDAGGFERDEHGVAAHVEIISEV